MLDGERFNKELEWSASLMASGRGGPLVDEANADRVRMWSKMGAEAIDSQDESKATRFLIALLVNLTDQHSMRQESLLVFLYQRLRRALLIPLWVSAVALVVLAFK